MISVMLVMLLITQSLDISMELGCFLGGFSIASSGQSTSSGRRVENRMVSFSQDSDDFYIFYLIWLKSFMDRFSIIKTLFWCFSHFDEKLKFKNGKTKSCMNPGIFLRISKSNLTEFVRPRSSIIDLDPCVISSQSFSSPQSVFMFFRRSFWSSSPSFSGWLSSLSLLNLLSG